MIDNFYLEEILGADVNRQLILNYSQLPFTSVSQNEFFSKTFLMIIILICTVKMNARVNTFYEIGFCFCQFHSIDSINSLSTSIVKRQVNGRKLKI